MLDVLENSDWGYVFDLAMPPAAVIGYGGSLGTFTRDDVAVVIVMVDGQNDGPDWIGIFHLNDGRFVAVRAGCDYTGFG